MIENYFSLHLIHTECEMRSMICSNDETRKSTAARKDITIDLLMS